MTTRVLLSRRAKELLGSAVDGLMTPVFLDGEIHDIDVAWASSDVFRTHDDTRRLFEATMRSPTLRWFHTSAAGVDHPIFGNYLDRGVALTTSNVTGPPIAEYVLRAVLDWYQRADEWRSNALAREWCDHEFRELLGTTWLVVGLGAIGMAVAERARAFGIRVIGIRRTLRGDEPVDELLPAERVLEAVPRADVVVLAAPATPETIGLVDERFLGLMREGTVLVNVARGRLVDEEALLAALELGIPEAALLDVTDVEPLPSDSRLWDHPRVVITPHTSALGYGRHERAAGVFAENLRRFVAGEPLVNQISDRRMIG